MEFKDYYKLLGVERSASQKEIKAAYRKMAKKHHPDANGGDDSKFKDLNEAYEVLKDPDKRQRYDSLGSNYRHGAQFDPRDMGGFGGFSGAGGQQIDIEELLRQQGMGDGGFGGSGFSSFFDVLFGGGGMGPGMSGMPPHMHQQQQRHHQAHGHPHAQQAPPAIEQRLPLSLETVARGGKQTVVVQATGKRLTVNIPQGISDGKKIRLGGQGPHGQDVFLVVNHQKHPAFWVEGDTLHTKAPIPLSTLVLGGAHTLSKLTGGSVELSIPKGAQTGQKMRLKGQGMPLGKNQTGDLIVTLQAAIPKTVPPEADALFRELQTLGY